MNHHAKNNASAPTGRVPFIVSRDVGALTVTELRKRFDALAADHEETRRERDALARKIALQSGSAPNTSAQCAELQKAVLSIREARDSLLARNQALMKELALAEEHIADGTLEKDNLALARDAAIQRANDLTRERDALRQEVEEAARQKAAAASIERGGPTIALMRQQVATLLQERDAARTALEEVRGQLEAARSGPPPEQRVLSELEDLRHRLAGVEAQTVGYSAQQKKNVEVLTRSAAAARDAMRAEFNEQRNAFEERIATLQAQLVAREQEMAAERASAEAEKASPATPTDGVNPIEPFDDGPNDTPIEEVETLLASCSAQLSVVPLEEVDPPNYETSVTLGAMRNCLQVLEQHPTGMELLEELTNHLQNLSDSAQASGLRAIYRFSSTCGELTHRLRIGSGKITPANVRLLQEALDLLDLLTGMRNAGDIADPADALVYTVDDDPDNCECICMAFEKMHLRTKYSLRPEAALTELTNTSCDLIIMDVDMPRMDGFELAARIRKIERHAFTPIALVSALTSTQERMDAAPSGANAYIAKPYNLHELGLRALSLILKARIVAQRTHA